MNYARTRKAAGQTWLNSQSKTVSDITQIADPQDESPTSRPSQTHRGHIVDCGCFVWSVLFSPFVRIRAPFAVRVVGTERETFFSDGFAGMSEISSFLGGVPEIPRRRRTRGPSISAVFIFVGWHSRRWFVPALLSPWQEDPPPQGSRFVHLRSGCSRNWRWRRCCP